LEKPRQVVSIKEQKVKCSKSRTIIPQTETEVRAEEVQKEKGTVPKEARSLVLKKAKD